MNDLIPAANTWFRVESLAAAHWLVWLYHQPNGALIEIGFGVIVAFVLFALLSYIEGQDRQRLYGISSRPTSRSKYGQWPK